MGSKLGSEDRVMIWGMPVMRLTMQQTLDRIRSLIREGKPGYVVTANLNYAMLAQEHPDLEGVNRAASILVADGMPLLWVAFLKGKPIRERVCGSDLMFTVSELAARSGYRVMLLGGAPGVGERAAQALCRRFPGLNIVGVEVPPFREMTEDEVRELIGRVRAARPQILLCGLRQPDGERFVARYAAEFGVPVCVQLGAGIDFAAGRVSRAPRWVRAAGFEWAYRIYLEPTRLAGRYWRNGVFLARSAWRAAFCPPPLRINPGRRRSAPPQPR